MNRSALRVMVMVLVVGSVSVVGSDPEDATRDTVMLGVQARELLARRDAQLRSLSAGIGKAANQDAAFTAQRALERHKLETENLLLELQARHARLRGDHELAAEIEAEVRAFAEQFDIEVKITQTDAAETGGR